MIARRAVPLFLALTSSSCGIVVLEDDPSAGGPSATHGATVDVTAVTTASSSSSGGGEGGGNGEGGGGAGPCVAQWTRIVGGASSNWLRSQAVGPDGSIAVAVDNLGEITLDGVPLGVEEGGIVVLKLDRNGELQWARRVEGSTQLPRLPVAFDSAGNVILGGIGYGEIDIGNGISSTLGGALGYVAKWSASGEPMWLQAWSVPIESSGLGNMTVDGGDNVYFNGGIGFDGDVVRWGTAVVTGNTFVGKILADGSPAWLRGYRGANIEPDGLVPTPSGHLVIATSLQGDGSFDGFALSSPGDFDALVLDLHPDGYITDARQFGDDALQRTSGLAIDPNGSRAIVGVTWGEVDFGGGTIGTPQEHRVFLAGFNAAGQSTWVRTAPEAYSPRVLRARQEGGFVFAGGADLAAAWGCAVNDIDGVVVATIDAGGVCTAATPLAKCGVDPNCGIFVNGVSATDSQMVASGYFFGDIQLGDATHVADIWDGFITSRSSCAAP